MATTQIAELDVICNVEGTITVKAVMEFAEVEELKNLLASDNTQKILARALQQILEHSYDYTSRSPDALRIAWHEDGNRDAYVHEVVDANLYVKETSTIQ